MAYNYELFQEVTEYINFKPNFSHICPRCLNGYSNYRTLLKEELNQNELVIHSGLKMDIYAECGKCGYLIYSGTIK